MRVLQITLMLLALLTLNAQLIHFSYKKLYYPKQSLLQDKIDSNIKNAVSIDDLYNQYQQAKTAVVLFEKNKTPEELRKISKYNQIEYKQQRKLHNAILAWERTEEQRLRMIIHWLAGLIILLIGSLLYVFRYAWLGMGFLIAGIAEFLWWSSPSFTMRGSSVEISKILNTKLTLTILSLAIVIALWLINEKRHKE